MDCETLKQKIQKTLKNSYFNDGEKHIRILVISRKFDIYEYKRSEREERV